MKDRLRVRFDFCNDVFLHHENYPHLTLRQAFESTWTKWKLNKRTPPFRKIGYHAYWEFLRRTFNREPQLLAYQRFIEKGGENLPLVGGTPPPRYAKSRFPPHSPGLLFIKKRAGMDFFILEEKYYDRLLVRELNRRTPGLGEKYRKQCKKDKWNL